MPRQLDPRNKSLKLNQVLSRLHNSSISKKNKNSIEEFYKFGLAVKNNGKDRSIRYIDFPLRMAIHFKKDFSKSSPNKSEIKSFILKIRSNEDWSPDYKYDWEVMARLFFTWLDYGDDYDTLLKERGYPSRISWIQPKIKEQDKKVWDKKSILSPEEVYELVDKETNPMYKFLISLNFETGARPEEILSLKWKDISVVKGEGLTVTIRQSKTKQRETPYLIRCIPYFKMFMSYAENRGKEDAVFVKQRKDGSTKKIESLTYDAYRIRLSRTCKKTNISKPVTPKMFRKARATELAQYLTEFQMCNFFGWKLGSRVPSHYVILRKEHLKKGLMQSAGQDIELKKEEKQMKKCSSCGRDNPIEVKECIRCFTPLSTEFILEKQKVMEKVLLNNPDTKKALFEEFFSEMLEKIKTGELKV